MRSCQNSASPACRAGSMTAPSPVTPWSHKETQGTITHQAKPPGPASRPAGTHACDPLSRTPRLSAAAQILADGQAGTSVGITGAHESAAWLPPAHSRAASPAKTRKHAGRNDRCTFLGVKGSRVQIPPSRPELAGQKGFRQSPGLLFDLRGASRGATHQADRYAVLAFSLKILSIVTIQWSGWPDWPSASTASGPASRSRSVASPGPTG
jgi:hypothetical protein